MIKYNTKKTIELQEWDKIVRETYGKVYSFQQQDGCQGRGNYTLSVSKEKIDDSDMPESVPENVNHPDMCVRFSSWLARDPKQPLSNEGKDGVVQWMIDLWWQRNFYPSVEVIANDLCRKGLIEEGEYTINIDW